jgi:hypothetical protein
VPASFQTLPTGKPVALVGKSFSVILSTTMGVVEPNCLKYEFNERTSWSKYCGEYSVGGNGKLGGANDFNAILIPLFHLGVHQL